LKSIILNNQHRQVRATDHFTTGLLTTEGVEFGIQALNDYFRWRIQTTRTSGPLELPGLRLGESSVASHPWQVAEADLFAAWESDRTVFHTRGDSKPPVLSAMLLMLRHKPDGLWLMSELVNPVGHLFEEGWLALAVHARDHPQDRAQLIWVARQAMQTLEKNGVLDGPATLIVVESGRLQTIRNFPVVRARMAVLGFLEWNAGLDGMADMVFQADIAGDRWQHYRAAIIRIARRSEGQFAHRRNLLGDCIWYRELLDQQTTMTLLVDSMRE
jgi:hypothetical protein